LDEARGDFFAGHARVASFAPTKNQHVRSEFAVKALGGVRKMARAAGPGWPYKLWHRRRDAESLRQFRVTERVGLRFRAEFFNIFNHLNFGNPNNDLTSPLFGQSTQTLASNLGSGGANGGFNPLFQIGGPRSIQLALNLQF